MKTFKAQLNITSMAVRCVLLHVVTHTPRPVHGILMDKYGLHLSSPVTFSIFPIASLQ